MRWWLCRCRRWVLQQVLQRFSAAACRSQQQHGEMESSDLQRSPMLNDQLTRTLHEEMKVCFDAACRYPSNYNAWSHRIWVLQHMARGNIKVCSRGVFKTNVAFCDRSIRHFFFPFSFSTMSCPPCVSGCPCTSLTTAASTIDSFFSKSSWQSSPRPQPPLTPPRTTRAQPPAAAPLIPVTQKLTESWRQQRRPAMRRGSSIPPQSFSSSTRSWSCAQIWFSHFQDMRRSGATGESKDQEKCLEQTGRWPYFYKLLY